MLTRPAARLVRRACIALTICSALLGLGVLTTPAQADTSWPTIDSYALSLPSTSVTSSTGKQLDLGIDANMLPSDCGASCDEGSFSEADVWLTTTNGAELHDWAGFDDDGSDFTVPTDGTPGSFDSQAELSPQGEVQLTLTAVGQPTDLKCGGQVVGTDQKVAVSGTVFFDTRSSGANAWGTVGTSEAPISLSVDADLQSQYDNDDCIFDTGSSAGGSDCAPKSSWFVAGANTFAVGIDGKKHTPYYLDRGVQQKDGLEREDDFTGNLASSKLALKGKHATVKIAGTGSRTTGTGTLHAKRIHTRNTTCGAKHLKRRDTIYSGTFENGHQPFTVHPQIFSAVSLKNGEKGEIDDFTKR